jgi:ubiquinone/menaquinone biosynthesis C-methylase UbiE
MDVAGTSLDMDYRAQAEAEGQRKKLKAVLDLLCCPATGQPLLIEQNTLVASDRSHAYRLSEAGLPLFAENAGSSDAETQRLHYDRIAANYIAHLQYPHTIEYAAYLDRALLQAVGAGNLGTIAEICCGRGEALQLVGMRAERAIGVDISQNMLEAGLADYAAEPNIVLVQGDATRLPLADGTFDSVFILGGIHHVNDRHALFSEVFRVLKPGGNFFFREPCSDFVLWRALRAIIYRLSSELDHTTERPLIEEETVPVLHSVGFELKNYERRGFLGFCFLMNSDVLIFNRAFRFIPGIRRLTRLAADFDEWVLHRQFMRRVGLQVVGCAVKPDLAADGGKSALEGPA